MDEGWIRDTFLALVQIDSHSLHEGDMAVHCRGVLEELGFTVEEDNAGARLGGETGNLIATLPGDPARIPFLLAAHMDTVQPGSGVKPHVDDSGTVHSDGSTVLGADDKAGITAILAAVRELVQSGTPHGTVQVLLTVAEEIGLQGVRHLQHEKLQAHFGLSLDSGGQPGTVVVAGPTQVRWSAEFVGRAAHAGVAPERGISAIKVAARAVAAMPHGRIDAETTVNIGSFVGDGPTNVVRDRVRLLGEARSRNTDKLTDVVGQIERAMQREAALADATVSFSAVPSYQGFRFEANHPLRQRAETAIQATGLTVVAVESGGGSDANILTELGVPTINIGIGYEDIHSPAEHIRLADILAAAQVVTAFLERA